MVLKPPSSTEGTVPNTGAAVPARKMPSWFEVLVTIEFTA